MKINRVCLIVGIILITLSLSVFVNACGCAVPVPTGCGVSTGCGVCIPQTNNCGGCVLFVTHLVFLTNLLVGMK